MPDLLKALRNADAAGDTEAARRIAAIIKRQQSQALNPDVPAGGTGPAYPDRPKAPDSTLSEKLIGAGEAALTIGSGATGGALGYLGGSIEGAARNLVGDISQDEAMKLAQERAAKYTYQPRGDVGAEIVKEIGEAASVLPPVLGVGVTPQTLSSGIKIPRSNNKTLNALGEAPELVQKSFKKKLGEDRFEPRIFNMVKAARKQGFDDSVTTLVANASPLDRRKFAKMISIVEKGKGDAREKALNRTADIAGDALVKKWSYVAGENKKAGQQLGRVAETLKGAKVDMSEPVNGFIKTLNEKLGVTFEKNMKPIFEGSDIETFPESIKLVNDLALKIKRNPSPTALDAHKFKKLIDKAVRYGKSDGKLDPDLERATKQLRANINDKLSAEFPKYKEANQRFSDTITALDDLQDVAGQKLDFSGPNSDKAAGVLLRGQTNNTKGRANLLTSIENLEDTAKKYGGSFDDNILSLSIFSDELDAVFGTGARTSLSSEVKKANIDAAIDLSQMTISGAVAVGAKEGVKRLRGINEENQLKAIKKLISQR